MLRIKPESRGTKKDCYGRIEQIVEKKIINVFDVLMGLKYSYVLQPGDTGRSLKDFLEMEAGVDVYKQTILFAENSQALQDDLLLQEQCKQTVQDVLFFNTEPGHDYKYHEMPMPNKVREMLGEPEKERKLTTLRSAWAQALFYCKSKADEYAMLLKSRSSLIKNIQHRWAALQSQKSTLEKEVIRLTSYVDMFKSSYDYDLMNRPEEFGQCGHNAMKEWKILYKHVDDFTSYKDLDDLFKELANKEEKIKVLKPHQQNPLEEEYVEKNSFVFLVLLEVFA